MEGKQRMRFMIGLGLAALLTAAPGVLASEDGHHGGHGDEAAGMSSGQAIRAVLEGNDQFRKNHDHGYFQAYQQGQTPSITVVSCSDSRVHSPLFGMDPHNNLFVIRNIGNQIRNSEGSVDYGVRHLPTRILLVMGHSSCGAVKAAMGDYSGETTGIRAELDPLQPVIARDDGKDDFNRRWAVNVERNVDFQVEYARSLYEEKVSTGELVVVGGVYDFNDHYGKGRGTLVITNINGETRPNVITGHPVLQELNKGVTVSHVGSVAPAVDWD